MRRIGLLLVLALAFPASAGAHAELRGLPYPGPGKACGGGAAISPTQVVEGSFGTELRGATVMVPFEVPRGTTEVRVRYCWDAPESPLATSGHTLDLGIWDAPERRDGTWAEEDFRGWGGSSHPDVQITPQGFAPGYAPDRKDNVPGYTTRGYLPGPIEPGR